MKVNRKPVIGIMGPASPADAAVLRQAEFLGQLIAAKGWLLLTGGRNSGVMDAASKGAKNAGGEVIGILPGSDRSLLSNYITIPIVTGLGSARNMINILSSDVVIVCGMGSGTASEAALAIKHNKPIYFTGISREDAGFFSRLSGNSYTIWDDPEELISEIDRFI